MIGSESICEFCGSKITPSAIDDLTKCPHCGFVNRFEQETVCSRCQQQEQLNKIFMEAIAEVSRHYKITVVDFMMQNLSKESFDIWVHMEDRN